MAAHLCPDSWNKLSSVIFLEVEEMKQHVFRLAPPNLTLLYDLLPEGPWEGMLLGLSGLETPVQLMPKHTPLQILIHQKMRFELFIKCRIYFKLQGLYGDLKIFLIFSLFLRKYFALKSAASELKTKKARMYGFIIHSFCPPTFNPPCQPSSQKSPAQEFCL